MVQLARETSPRVEFKSCESWRKNIYGGIVPITDCKNKRKKDLILLMQVIKMYAKIQSGSCLVDSIVSQDSFASSVGNKINLPKTSQWWKQCGKLNKKQLQTTSTRTLNFYVENLPDVRSKNHGTLRSTSKSSTIIKIDTNGSSLVFN